ncbi:hypothetical protein BDV39DRAFT_172027, partial [Aspergillus sergii]
MLYLHDKQLRPQSGMAGTKPWRRNSPNQRRNSLNPGHSNVRLACTIPVHIGLRSPLLQSTLSVDHIDNPPHFDDAIACHESESVIITNIGWNDAGRRSGYIKVD